MTNIEKQLKDFAEELRPNMLDEEILDLYRRVKKFYADNDVPNNEDYLVNSGYGEMLEMLVRCVK